MAAKWLYSVGYEGIRVTAGRMERLRSGHAGALRSLQKQPLSKLYRANFTREPRRSDAHGFWWSDIDDELKNTVLIPFVRGGRSRNRAWLPNSVYWIEKALTQRRSRALWRMIRIAQRHTRTPPRPKRPSVFDPEPREGWSSPEPDRREQALSVKIAKGGKGVTVTTLKPNPKFELVVVNRFDKAALLKLLDELDSAENVAPWLHERTVRRGATAHKLLHADYSVWCEQRGEAAAGKKTFAQTLIAAGVVKLTRGNAGVRYELELR